MKVLILFLSLLISVFLFGQQDVEDRDDSFITETNKNILKIDIKESLLQIAIKNCTDFKTAAYKGGASVYKETLRKYMYNYLNSDFYVLNGDFNFTITINETGKVVGIDGSPKVANSEIFF
ncbi:hypothetical protein AAEU33_05850 [Chryseobacterium sp. Chry.R1]|uniref:hypothetical protein n=1 Tax=Chryseobacterium sp. Chry.R1 TaxID=3139392 RepID=UPI0031F780AF